MLVLKNHDGPLFRQACPYAVGPFARLVPDSSLGQPPLREMVAIALGAVGFEYDALCIGHDDAAPGAACSLEKPLEAWLGDLQQRTVLFTKTREVGLRQFPGGCSAGRVETIIDHGPAPGRRHDRCGRIDAFLNGRSDPIHMGHCRTCRTHTLFLPCGKFKTCSWLNSTKTRRNCQKFFLSGPERRQS